MDNWPQQDNEPDEDQCDNRSSPITTTTDSTAKSKQGDQQKTSSSAAAADRQQHHRRPPAISPPLHRENNEWSQLKRARLTTSLNHRLVTRPGPLELIEGNILPANVLLQQALQRGSIQFKRTKEGKSCPTTTEGEPAESDPKIITGQSAAFEQTTEASGNRMENFHLSSSLPPPALSVNQDGLLCHAQSPLFSPLNLDLPIDLDQLNAINSPIYAIGCPSPLLQRIPLMNGRPTLNVTPATNLTMANEASAITVGSTAVIANGQQPLHGAPSMLNQGLRHHQLPSTIQFHLQQNQFRHNAMLNAMGTNAGNARCTGGSHFLLSRNKKSKSKTQPKIKTIKFHEYKGPPNAPAPKTPPPQPQSSSSSSSILKESPESSYELLLKQQQLFLQWQLECQHKNGQIASPSIVSAIHLNDFDGHFY